MYRSILLPLVLATSVASQEDIALRNRFLKEAPAAWNEYLKSASHAQGEVSSTEVNLLTGQTIRRDASMTLKLNGHLGLTINPRGDEPDRLKCLSRSHEFILDAVLPDDWILRQILPNDRNYTVSVGSLTRPRTETLGGSPWQHAMACTCRGLIIGTTWLPAMFYAPSFRIVDIRPENNRGEGLVRIDFEYNPEITRNNPVRDGYVILDPSRYWLIKSAASEAIWPQDLTVGFVCISNEFDDRTLDFPYAVRHVLTTLIPFSGNEITPVYNEKIFITKLRRMEESDMAPFELSTYDIPATHSSKP